MFMQEAPQVSTAAAPTGRFVLGGIAWVKPIGGRVARVERGAIRGPVVKLRR